MLTLNEAASLLKVHPEALRRWAKTGKVPCYRLGRLYRFDRDKLLGAILMCKIPKEEVCTNVEASGTSVSQEYANLLGLPRGKTQKP